MSIIDDLSAIYDDPALTVPVVYGSVNARGFFDARDVQMGDSSSEVVLVPMRTLTIATGALGTVTTGSSIVVDGTTYTIHDARRINDGNEMEILLA